MLVNNLMPRSPPAGSERLCDNTDAMDKGDDWKQRINIDPAIQNGRPVVRGTRVPLYVLVGALAGGDSLEDVCEGWNVTEEDVRAALAYSAHLLGRKRAHALRD
jgi:uncharacterized protein (DUF433 family)